MKPVSISSSTTTTVVSDTPTPEKTRSIGEIVGSTTENIALDEKIIFNHGNSEHSIKLIILESTSATLQTKDGASHTLNIGEERAIDDNTNSQIDYTLKLKSVNEVSNTARILITGI